MNAIGDSNDQFPEYPFKSGSFYASSLLKFKLRCPCEDCVFDVISKPLHSITGSIKQPNNNHLEISNDFPKQITYDCTVNKCQAFFSTKRYLRQHIQKVHRTAGIKCTYPNCKSYLKPDILSKHIKTVHKKIQQSCENCGKQVSFPNLQKHLVRCTSDAIKRFRCELEGCGAMFLTNLDLKAHLIKVHTLPVKCPMVDCEAYMKPQHLNTHIKRIHQKIRRVCDNCGDKFVCLAEHAKRCGSDGIRKFRCGVADCKSSFALRQDLRVHMRRTHSTDKVRCPYENCYGYIKQTSLFQHIKTIHKGDDASDLKRLREICDRDMVEV